MHSNSRRTFLKLLAAAAALPVAGHALAEAKPAPLARLAESDPAAKNLGYTENAAKIDPAKEPTYKKGSKCAGCALYQAAQASGGYAPCLAFAGKAVNANGWCRAFAPKA